MGTRGIFYRCTIASALRRTILCLADIGHRTEQPDTCCHQHNEKTEHYGIFDSAITLVVGRFGLGHRSVVYSAGG